MLHVRDGLLVEHIDAGGRALAHGRQKSAPAARQMADASKPRDIVRVVDLPGMEVFCGPSLLRRGIRPKSKCMPV